MNNQSGLWNSTVSEPRIVTIGVQGRVAAEDLEAIEQRVRSQLPATYYVIAHDESVTINVY